MSTNMRWQRLAVTLAEHGVDAAVDERPYPGGVTRSIVIRRPNGGVVEISDQWWSKNVDVWIGYGVYKVGRDDITEKSYPYSKNRRTVVDYVKDALS